MRITFVVPVYGHKPIGGVAVTYRYANAMASRGHDVSVVHGAFMQPRQYARRLRYGRDLKIAARGAADLASGPPKNGGARGPAFFKMLPQVNLVYAVTLSPRHVPDADAVVSTSWRTAEAVARYPHAKGLHFQLIQHYETWDGPKRRVDRTWALPSQRIVISKWLASIADGLGVADGTVLIPYGMDLSEMAPGAPLEGRPQRVAMMWSPAREKGAKVGLAALTLARRRLPRLEAALFGVRPRPRSLPSWVDYFHDPDRRTLSTELYSKSSIFLCPSWSEGFGLPGAEAMACGCALVTTDNGGVADYATGHITALICPVGDSRALADALCQLCEDEDLRYRMARAGRDKAQSLEWEPSFDKFEHYLEAGAGGGVRASEPSTHQAGTQAREAV